MRDRFDIDLLDPDDPFEVDGRNLPHLYKHLPAVSGRYVAVGVEEILDVYLYGDPMYEPGHEEGEADWIMIGENARDRPPKYRWHHRTDLIRGNADPLACMAQPMENVDGTENG